ncbi:MAG: hypothetical protein K6A44_05395 [bacterium]|nr:hypothetical protein [bacterium]
MINPVTSPKCFSAFNSSTHKNNAPSETPTKVKAASLIGAGICALGAAELIARRQGKALNKAINLFNAKYNEPELIGVAMASIVGGLAAGGAADDKKYMPIKIKEATHQALANVLAPLLLVGGLNKIYDKYPIKNFPQFAPTSNIRKFANEGIKMLPRLGIAAIGLTGGVLMGTSISNKINSLECTEHERKVKALDFIYHPDDFAAAFAVADKKGVLQKFVSKIIPPIFMLHGYETGTRR